MRKESMDEQVQVIPEKRQLRVSFTPDEMLDMSRQLCDEIREQAKLTEELASIKSDYKGRLGDVTTKINELVAKVSAGCETRDVECEKHLDFAQNLARVVRLDTGEIVEERGLLTSERQLILEVGRQSALDTLDEIVRKQPATEEEKPPETEG